MSAFTFIYYIFHNTHMLQFFRSQCQCFIAGQDAVACAESLRCRAAEPIPFEAEAIRATTSIGVTLARPGEGIDALLARADDAMYRAKAGGKNRVVAAEAAATVTAAS